MPPYGPYIFFGGKTGSISRKSTWLSESIDIQFPSENHLFTQRLLSTSKLTIIRVQPNFKAMRLDSYFLKELQHNSAFYKSCCDFFLNRWIETIKQKLNDLAPSKDLERRSYIRIWHTGNRLGFHLLESTMTPMHLTSTRIPWLYWLGSSHSMKINENVIAELILSTLYGYSFFFYLDIFSHIWHRKMWYDWWNTS